MRYLLLPLLMLLSLPAFATEPQQSFSAWLVQFEQNARAQGIREDIISNAFENVEAPADDVMQLDHKQPEGTKTFSDYMDGILTDKRIARAKENYRLHRKLLRKIEAKYHVPHSILLSLWALESNFGTHQGEYSVVESLTTLAYDNRRRQFFSEELMDALKIMQNENMQTEDLTGSWAGAMGQTQFMPSSYLRYAVDFDGCGKKDIWNSDADALASIANYLHSKGWDYKHGWGMRVTLPAHLVIPDDDSDAFLVFPNYNILMDWNRSIYFATSVGLLSDEIGKK